ncbi:CgeB family protein [Methylophaga sp. OBS3]|uniref:CgeB family protein n=1 Tax=Methylophaga sp. OBS3 TaxID=2991934 RepID=UPI0022598985|nr:glycosyltransferase [Methylophaga sp. OBS3]MCX4190748.1 glycosyltransferase [Methylophaga sp. OBS3]
MTKNILILDGIGGISLGKDIHQSVLDLGERSQYCNLASLPRLRFYKPREAIKKIRNKQLDKDSFTYLPKCRFDALEGIFKLNQPNIVIVVGFVYRFIDPKALKNLAMRYKAKLFLYDTDSCNLYSNRREFIFFLQQEISVYDHVFSFSKVVTDFLQRKGYQASFSPFGAHSVQLPERNKVDRDVLFVGSGDLRRIFMLEHIAEYVSVFGSRWKRHFPLMSDALKQSVTDKPVWGNDLYQHMANAKIILNITRAPFYAAETGINLRIFEAMAAGCFMLTDYCDEVANIFELGKEIETFNGSDELRDKVQFYLKNDSSRQAIAQRAREKVSKLYTWPVRVNDMLNQIDKVIVD